MKKLLPLVFMLGLASPALAQDVRTLIFTASADHSVTLAGQPIVTGYQVDLMVGTPTGALAFSQSLGKPTPAAPVPPATVGDITIDLTQFPTYNALTRGQYVAFVTAIGPGGTTRSVASDPFTRFGLPAAPGKPRATP